jgi:hypothetical protein
MRIVEPIGRVIVSSPNMAARPASKTRSIKFLKPLDRRRALIPRTHFRAVQIDAIGQQSERFGSQLQLHARSFDGARPGKSSLSQPLGHHPKTRAIPVEYLEPSAPFVRKDKQRSGARIFAEALRDQPVKAIETLAQIDRMQSRKL